MIANEAHEDATVIWGVAFDPEMEDAMKVTIVATGFENNHEKLAPTTAAPAVKKPAATVAPAAVEEKPAAASDDISDDELDELLGMLQKKDKKDDFNGTIPGVKRYF
jgi:cell division protein FtsZ